MNTKQKKFKPNLIIICGLPGSGKTSLAKKLEIQYQGIRFCPDEWMEKLSINLHNEILRAKIESLQWEIVQNFLIVSGTAIIEWGTWGKSERETLRLRAKELGAKVILYYLRASIDELYKRIQFRGMEDPPIKKETVIKWFDIFQAPDKDEIELYDEFYSMT